MLLPWERIQDGSSSSDATRSSSASINGDQEVFVLIDSTDASSGAPSPAAVSESSNRSKKKPKPKGKKDNWRQAQASSRAKGKAKDQKAKEGFIRAVGAAKGKEPATREDREHAPRADSRETPKKDRLGLPEKGIPKQSDKGDRPAQLEETQSAAPQRGEGARFLQEPSALYREPSSFESSHKKVKTQFASAKEEEESSSRQADTTAKHIEPIRIPSSAIVPKNSQILEAGAQRTVRSIDEGVAIEGLARKSTAVKTAERPANPITTLASSSRIALSPARSVVEESIAHTFAEEPLPPPRVLNFDRCGSAAAKKSGSSGAKDATDDQCRLVRPARPEVARSAEDCKSTAVTPIDTEVEALPSRVMPRDTRTPTVDAEATPNLAIMRLSVNCARLWNQVDQRSRWLTSLDCQFPGVCNGSSVSSAVLAVSPRGKVILQGEHDESSGRSSLTDHVDNSFSVEDVRRLSSRVAGIACTSSQRIGEGAPQVSLLFARHSATPRQGQEEEKGKLGLGARTVKLNARPHLTGATAISPFLLLGDDALSFVTGGTEGALFAWSYSTQKEAAACGTASRLHALHRHPVTSIEILPKSDLVVSSASAARTGAGTDLVAFDGRHMQLAHAWRSSDTVAHISRTSHAKLLDISFLRTDYDQHRLYDLRTTSAGGSSRSPTKPVVSFGWSSELDFTSLGRPAFWKSYCVQGCPDGKVRTWDLRKASDVLQEIQVTQNAEPVTDVMLQRGPIETRHRADSQHLGVVAEHSATSSSPTSLYALAPGSLWRLPMV